MIQVGNLLLTADQVNFGITPIAAVFWGEDIGVYRLMGAVERAKAQVHNTWHQFAAIVGRESCLSG